MFDEVIYLSMGNKEGEFIKYFAFSQKVFRVSFEKHALL
jgi:hypothetical protein